MRIGSREGVSEAWEALTEFLVPPEGESRIPVDVPHRFYGWDRLDFHPIPITVVRAGASE